MNRRDTHRRILVEVEALAVALQDNIVRLSHAAPRAIRLGVCAAHPRGNSPGRADLGKATPQCVPSDPARRSRFSVCGPGCNAVRVGAMGRVNRLMERRVLRRAACRVPCASGSPATTPGPVGERSQPRTAGAQPRFVDPRPPVADKEARDWRHPRAVFQRDYPAATAGVGKELRYPWRCTLHWGLW
jgi:hypothetical protein